MPQHAMQSLSLPEEPAGQEDEAPARAETRGRPRSEVSQDAILAATLQLLMEKPLRDITMEEIARKASAGKATIYKWWPSKAYVALDAFLKRMNRMVATPDTGSAERDFREQLSSLIEFYTGPMGNVFNQFIAEGQSDKKFAHLFRERFLKPRREVVGLIFDRGVKRGEIAATMDRELILDMVYGPVIWRQMTGYGHLDHQVADCVISILFRGLKQHPKPAPSNPRPSRHPR